MLFRAANKGSGTGFNPSSVAIILYELIDGKWEVWKRLMFKDFINMKSDFDYLGANHIELTVQSRELMREMHTKVQKKRVLLIERSIYGERRDDDTSVTAAYNPIFFLSYDGVAYEGGNGTYTVRGTDWKGYIESRRIVEHNVFYDSFPIDESGNEEVPDDFNKIKYNDGLVEDIITDMYNRNIGSSDPNHPVYRVKGKNPSSMGANQKRKVGGYDSMQLNVVDMMPYTILSDKKSILNFKTEMYTYARSINVSNVYNVELKLLPNGLLKVVHNPSRSIRVDNYFSKDKPISASYQLDLSGYYNDVAVESGSNNFDFVNQNGANTSDLTSFELLESGNSDNGDTSGLQTQADTVLKEKKEKTTTTFEIEFTTKEFLKDIKVCDIVELTNFSDEFNGLYQIQKISEIIENGYISYAIDEMELLVDFDLQKIFEIYNVQDLQAIETNPDKGNPEAIFKIMNDIDCSSITDFISITNFGATLNGQGHSIYKYNSTTNGVFVTTNGAIIKNTFVSGTVDITNERIGLLVGNAVHTTITNCGSNGSVTANDYVGGLIGWSEETTISNCFASTTILGGQFIGGLIGYTLGGIVDNSCATGNVSGNSYSSVYHNAGGLIGGTGSTNINNSYATGNVSGENNVGGIIGNFYQGTLNNSYATGDVSGNDNVGSVVGYDQGTGSNLYAYELQLINGVPVTSDGSATGIATYLEVSTTSWHTDVLGFAKVDWTFQDGCYPHVKGTDGVILPNQEWIPVRTVEIHIIEVTNVQELQAIHNHPDKANSAITFSVMNNIDCSSIVDFQSIIDFGAQFDGQGYKIFNYNSTTNGLFANTLLGSTIKNVHVSGSIVTAIDSPNIGMLIGEAIDSEIVGCGSSGSINTGDSNTGGLIGKCKGIVANSYSFCDIQSEGYTGGLIGSVEVSSSVSNCYTTGNGYTGEENYCIGGLVGYVKQSVDTVIDCCFTIGNVDGMAYARAGGLLGYVAGDSTIRNSYSTAHVKADNDYSEALIGNDGLTFVATNLYAYEYQLLHNVLVDSNTDDYATAIATQEQISTTTWHTDVLGFSTTNWIFQDGYCPKLKGADGVELPYQEWIPIKTGAAPTTEITTAEELQAVISHADRHNPAVTFSVMNDIDCSSVTDFVPIDFGATFDGQGFRIYNYNSTKNGMFASVYTEATIKRTHISGTVDCNVGGGNTGLLAGSSSGAAFLDCSSEGDISVNTTYTRIGGLIGSATAASTINNCFSLANVSGYDDVGGLIGFSNGNNIITNVYAMGDVSGGLGTNFGGLIADNSGSTVNGAYATGNVTGEERVGGLVGADDFNDGTIMNAYATGDVTGNSYAKGFIGYGSGGSSNSYAYEHQLINNVPVDASSSGGGSGVTISTQAQVATMVWHTDVLGFDTTNWVFQDGYCPKLKGTDGVELPNQIWIPVRST